MAFRPGTLIINEKDPGAGSFTANSRLFHRPRHRVFKRGAAPAPAPDSRQQPEPRAAREFRVTREFANGHAVFERSANNEQNADPLGRDPSPSRSQNQRKAEEENNDPREHRMPDMPVRPAAHNGLSAAIPDLRRGSTWKSQEVDGPGKSPSSLHGRAPVKFPNYPFTAPEERPATICLSATR